MKDERKTKKQLIAELEELRGKARVSDTSNEYLPIDKLAALSAAVLERLNDPIAEMDDIRGLLEIIRDYVGFEAVGIRLRDGEDFPYFETRGFPSSFVKAETNLCTHNKKGELLRDENGEPYLECMCGNVISGKIDRSMPIFTDGGSFWTNSTTQLLASMPDNGMKAGLRNRCNRQGYESVALIPLKVGDETVGLLQLDDKRKGLLSVKAVEYLEKIACGIGATIKRVRSEASLYNTLETLRSNEKLFKTVAQNLGDAIITIDSHSIVVFWNKSAEKIFGYSSEEMVGKPLSAILPGEMDTAHRKSVRNAPEGRCSGIWGRAIEVTGRKKDGSEAPVELTLTDWKSGDNKYFTAIVRDVAERKKAEEVLSWESQVNEMLSHLSRLIVSSVTIGEISELVLNYAKTLTESEFGYVGYIDENNGYLVCPTLTREVWDACRVEDKSVVFKKWGGLWGWVLDNKRSMYSNDPSADERSSGVPAGHIPVNNFLSAPAMVSGELVGQVAVINSARPYTERDQLLVERIADIYAIAIQRKQNEDALMMAAREWQSTFNSMTDAVLLVNRDFRIVRYNRAAELILGLTPHDVLTKQCYQCLHGADSPPEYCPHAKTLKEDREFTEEVYDSERKKWFLTITTPMHDNSGTLIGSVHVLHDITFRREAEEELKKHRDHLEELVRERAAELVRTNERLVAEIADREAAEKEKERAQKELEEQRTLAICADRLRSLGEMAAGIAHELNQPLLGVRGLAEHIMIGLDRGWKVDEDKLKEKVKLIVDQADRMTHVIEHVRMFARGADETELIETDVNEVIKSGLGLMTAQLRSRGMKLEYNLQEGIPRVMANPFSLEEVILNLVSNARDAIEEKQKVAGLSNVPLIRVLTRSEKVDSTGYVVIEVVDEGIGVIPEKMDRIFDPFFTTKDPQRGTGLGLAISKSIVEGFGGSIEVESTPGEGAMVRVTLPAGPGS